MSLDLSDIALPQEVLEVDGVSYLVTAMPATDGLQFMESHQESLEKGKADLALMRRVICKFVSKDNKSITEKSFNIIFARKYGHLSKLYQAVIEYNFGESDEAFQEAGSEE